MSKDAKKQKKERRVNPLKKAKKDEKRKVASDGRVKARESLRERREKIAQSKAKKEKIEKELENAEEEEAKKMRAEIDTIMSELQEDEKAVEEAEATEAKFKQDEEEAEKEDEYSDMDVDDEDDPDKPRDSIEETEETPEFLEKLMKGIRLGDPHFDLKQDSQLRNTQAVLCYKNGFGKPAIVVDYEFPKNQIYRIRNDILIPDSTPNLMKWRRAGKVNPKTGKKWSVEDMQPVFPRIAIKVPPGYERDPEDLVKLIPAISGAEKDALKKAGKPAPKQPDVQMYIEWKDGFIPEGETEERFSSWESRSCCRTLWKKQIIADNFLVNVATKREEAYRNAGGKNSSEPRSMSPFEFPRAGSQSDREYTQTPEVGEGEENTKKEDAEKKKEEEEKKEREDEEKKKKKEKEEREKKEENDDDDDEQLEKFEKLWRTRNKVKKGDELTPVQEGRMIQAFEAYSEAQKQAAKRDSKL